MGERAVSWRKRASVDCRAGAASCGGSPLSASRDGHRNKSSPAIVGRGEELSLISSMLDEVSRGAGATLIISGEGGVGKTSLITAAAEDAARNGWQVVLGRAYAVETGIPYALFSDAFVPFLQALEPGALSVLTRGGVRELAYLFPVLGAPGDREKVAAGSDAADLKARLQWNFTQFLGRLSTRQPLCIVLENLQWADASSLELFHFVARQIGTQRIALLASYNETERDANPILKTTEQSLASIGAAAHMRLGPLSADSVAELVQRRFSQDPDVVRIFAARLHEWTRGNAFFVDETLKWLVETGSLHGEGSTWGEWDTKALQLPPTVRDTVTSRIDRLSKDAREVASLAAVFGARMTYEQLRAITGLDDESLVAIIEELARQKVLEEIPLTGRTAYDFAHPILQQVAYSAVGARARLLHGQIAESLEELYGSDVASHAGELAFHFARSAALGNKAVKYLSEAGRTALESYANREAAAFLESALRHAESGSPQRDDIVRNLARAKQRLGDYEGALDLWRDARQSASSRGDSAGLGDIDYRMGLAAFWSGRFDDALAHYENGLGASASAADKPTAVRIYLAKAICLQELGRIDAAKAEAESALQAAGDSGSDALLSRAHRALLLLYAWTGPASVAKEHGKRAIEYAEASDEKMLQWTAHWGIAVLSGLTGNASEALRQIQQCHRLEESLQSPLLPLWTAELSIQYASWLGNWDDGIATGERTIALARSLNQRTLVPRLLVWTGLLYLWRHDLEKARSYFDEAWTLSGAGTATEHRIDVQTVVPAHMGLAAYHLETDNLSEAIRIGEAGLHLADKLGYIAWSVQWLLPVIGEAALWSRDFERSEKHCARLRRDGEKLSNPIAVAMADTGEGMLLMLRDSNPAGAIPLLRSAIESLEQIPLPDVASRIRRALAQALTESHDREGALRELRIAHDTFARLGSAGELENVRSEIRKLGSRPPPRTSVEGIGGLTGRELEIARMVASRKSNRDIGEALDISARTVSTHLSNIFAKTGVASRGELADFIRESALAEET